MFVCVFSPNPFSPATLPSLQACFELLDGFDAQLVVQGLDLLRAQAGDFEHRDQPGRGRSLQLLVILQLAGGDEFGDLLLERLADAFDFAQALFGDELVQRLAQRLERARGILIGAGLERVLALQLQQRRNAANTSAT